MVRTLSIGTDVEGLTDYIGWNDETNINDYDIVFLNLHSLEAIVGDDSMAEVDDAGSAAIPSSEKVKEHMVAGKSLIVLLPTKTRLRDSRNRIAFFYFFRWSPLSLDIHFEEGRGIQQSSISDSWDWYYDGSEFDWDLFIEGRESTDKGLKYEVNAIVENTYNKSVSGRIKYFELFKNAMGEIGWRKLPGQVVFLPVLDSWSYEDIISDTLYYVFEGHTEPRSEDAPEWVDKYSVPGEQDAAERVDTLQTEIDSLQSELSEQEEELSEIRDMKGLLYGGNDFLERLVPRTFRGMGFDVEGEITGNRDGLIDLGEKKVILETHGTTNGISKKKCRQLHNHVGDYQYEHSDEDVFGVLAVNPFRKQPLSERSQPYNSDVVDYVDRCGNKILLTEDLFRMYVEYHKGKLTQSDVIETLTSDNVVINHTEASE